MNRFPLIRNTPPKYDPLGELLCRNCENPVASGRRFYCSPSCMHTFVENHSWYWVRKAVLRRDTYRCSICKNRKRKAELDVDHIIPVRMGIDPFEKKNLRVLCKDCHAAKSELDREALHS